MISAKQRVANGVEFLNRNLRNWRDSIDISKLDLSCPNNCIMGQIGWPKEDTYKGISATMNCDVAELFGFLRSVDADYDELQVEWLKVLS